MAIKRVTAPAETPVTLAEAKAHIAVTHDSDDAMVQIYLDAATSHLDGADGTLGRCLVTQTWKLVVDAFPVGALRLPLPPLQSVTSITYTDADGLTQTMDAADYIVDDVSQPGWVVPVNSWPSTAATPNAVSVQFVAGYGTAADVPAALRAAILLYVGDMYANREAAGDALIENPAVDRLVWPYRANLGL